MHTTLLSLIFITLPSFALAAQKKDHWYKVESPKQERQNKKKDHYLYDSVEKSKMNRSFEAENFWSLRPKISLGGGYHADKALFNEGKTNRFFINGSLAFRNRPWHRLVANILLLQNNSLFTGFSVEFTPSREKNRTYYGFGVAHQMVADKEFSNLVDVDNYYVTAQYGWEFLRPDSHGFSVELKGFLSSTNYAIQFGGAYIIPF